MHHIRQPRLRYVCQTLRASTKHSRRPFGTTSPCCHPTVVNTPARPDLMTRIPERPLPSLASLSSTRKWLKTFPIFVGVITISALGIFNYQKVNSPVITATMYSLRTNPRVRAELGDEVYFASGWAYIWGSINLVQGRVDVSFRVKGTRNKGLCRFRAKREGGRSGAFRTQEWSLTTDDGKQLQLLEENGRDPLGGASF